MEAELSARLERMLDRQDILDCLTRFSRGMARFDEELFLSAFHPDATIAAGALVWRRVVEGVVAASLPATLPLPSPPGPAVQRNGAPARGKEDPSYRRPLVNLREPHVPAGVGG